MQDPFLQKDACSQLALLSQREYQDGLNKLKKHLDQIIDPQYHYQNEIVLSMLRAEKPGWIV
jgi:hypothetical protein